MKFVTLIMSLTLCSSTAFSGIDSLFVTIAGDTATIWHKNTLSNCASKFDFEITLSTDTITIVETDTVGPLVHCTCSFDLNVRLRNVWGTHTVLVYRQLLKKYFYQNDTMLFIGSTQFTLPGPSVLPYFAIDNYQSTCGGDPVYAVKQNAVKHLDGDVFSYPNPFNTTTTIIFSLRERDDVVLKIVDLLGRETMRLVDAELESGEHRIFWNASSASSGVYFLSLTTGTHSVMQKIILMK
ncbi:MAG: T9SS type A sorting domain-containing protein [Bacteroidetes bacterium]|nr:T9SS type A sorting domain-containing protein [Bacteroidota bacterium]